MFREERKAQAGFMHRRRVEHNGRDFYQNDSTYKVANEAEEATEMEKERSSGQMNLHL